MTTTIIVIIIEQKLITDYCCYYKATQTCFSQHWNDQGIARLRAALDSVSKTVVIVVDIVIIAFIAVIMVESYIRFNSNITVCF